MKKVIHTNRHVIAANKKSGRRDPVFTVKTYKSNTLATSVRCEGVTILKYNQDRPLKCGATAWIETSGPVMCFDKEGGYTRIL